ncbi:MAG: AAA family ATPase, partial [Burkholderiaceae bacterium]
MASQLVQRIAVVGAESTGKTSLAQALSEHVSAVVVPEHLRQFVEQHGRVPTQSEQTPLMREQIRAEQAAVEQAASLGYPFVLCDSSAIMTAVYSEFYFGDETLYGAALTYHQQVSLTLFCQPDLPWVADTGQRDGPHVQQAVHDLLVRRLQGLSGPVVPIVGAGDSRVRLAIRAMAAL